MAVLDVVTLDTMTRPVDAPPEEERQEDAPPKEERPVGVLTESGFLITPVADGYRLQVVVADPRGGPSSGGLSTERSTLALMVTAIVKVDGSIDPPAVSIGPPAVEMAVVKVRRRLSYREATEKLRNPSDDDFPMLEKAHNLAMALLAHRNARAYRRVADGRLRGAGLDNEINLLANHLFAVYATARGLPFEYLTSPGGPAGSSAEGQSLAREATGYRAYGRVTPAIRAADANKNAASLIEHCISRALGEPTGGLPEWMGDLELAARGAANDMAATGPSRAGTGLLSRYVEIAELLGPPERWLVAAVNRCLTDQSRGRAIALLVPLLVHLAEPRPEWAGLRKAAIATCVNQSASADEVMAYCVRDGTFRDVETAYDRWPTDALDGMTVEMVRCRFSVTSPSGMVWPSSGYGKSPKDARRAAIISFLADRAGVERPSPAPFKLPTAYRCLIENRPDLVGGISPAWMAVAVSHLQHVDEVPPSLLAELGTRIAAGGRSAAVTAAVLAAVPDSPAAVSQAWRDLVDTVAKAAATSPVFASNLLNEGARRGAWSPPRKMDGAYWVLHRGAWLREASSAAGAGSPRLIAAICASLVTGVDPPGTALGDGR